MDLPGIVARIYARHAAFEHRDLARMMRFVPADVEAFAIEAAG
jgi:hypothetical protein